MEVQLTPISEELLFSSITYTDGIAGSLQVKTPRNFDGDKVMSRETLYTGHTQIQTSHGPMTVSFEIKAETLREAFHKWPEAAAQAIKGAIEDIQRQQFQKSLLAPMGKKS